MDAQQPIEITSTCQSKKANGEFCKRSVTEGEDYCWQHATSVRHRLKSLTHNQALAFGLVLLGVVLSVPGIPGLYFSYVSWRDTHPPLTVPKPPTQLSGVMHLPVSVVPAAQAFVSDFVHDNYIFKISNETDNDLYQVEVVFIITASTLSFRDFTIEIPASSRKAIIDGSHFLDMNGARGSDATGRPLLLLSIHRLIPHEVREITFTRNKRATATVNAAWTYSTAAPQPRIAEPNKMMETFHPPDKATFDTWITFLANGTAHPRGLTLKLQKNTVEHSSPINSAVILSNVSDINLKERGAQLTHVLTENWKRYHRQGDLISNRAMTAQKDPAAGKAIDKEFDQLIKECESDNRENLAEAIAVKDEMLKRFGPSPEADALKNIIYRFADLTSSFVH